MCGRFNLFRPAELRERFHASTDLGELPPRYNIAPGQRVLIITDGAQMDLVRWGLVPHWAKEATFSAKTINARAETVATKPAYRRAFRHQRCLIPATGFFEWQTTPQGKVPYHIQLADGEIFTFAGLYDTWTDAEGQELRTCTIITTTANEVMSAIHPRMPVILRREDETMWVDSDVTDPERLEPLLAPYPAERMAAYPVTALVNRTANDSEEVIQPAGESVEQGGLW